MLHLLPVPFAVIGIVIYWWARWTNNLSLVSVVQPVITILCMVIVLLSFRKKEVSKKLSIIVLISLALALLGDFLNVDMTDPFVVIRGLIIFVAAYLTYAIGFTVLNGFHKKDIYVGIVALALYTGLMSYLWPYLGDMRIPGLIYGLLLPFLVTRGVSTFFGHAFSRTQAILITIGTLCLYLGDVEFALHSYPQIMPMIFGPFLYSGGQLLISLSTNYGKSK